MRIRRVLLLLTLLQPSLSAASEVSFLAGTSESSDIDGSTYGWQLDVRYCLESPFALSVSWINEGHLPGHHRDGPAVRLWGRLPLWKDRVSLSLGIGAYQFFDTRPAPGGSHVNTHGVAPVFGLSASYATRSPWLILVSVNHIHPGGEIDSTAVLLGLGYRLRGNSEGGPPDPPALREPPFPGNTGSEVTMLLGDTIHNSLDSRQGLAAGIEIRKGISPHLDATLVWIHEDNQGEIRRTGLGGQIWLVDPIRERRVFLGLGIGLYTFRDRNPPGGDSGKLAVAGLSTLAAGYRFTERWFGRIHWYRVATHDHRDSDILLLGLGYGWRE